MTKILQYQHQTFECYFTYRVLNCCWIIGFGTHVTETHTWGFSNTGLLDIFTLFSRAKTMPVTSPQPKATSEWLPRNEPCPQKGVTVSRQRENDKNQSTPMALSQNQITSLTYSQCWHPFLHSKSSARSIKFDYWLGMASLSEVKWKAVSPVKADSCVYHFTLRVISSGVGALICCWFSS